MRKKLALILALTLLCTLLAACGKKESADGDTIKIGHIVDRTGSEAKTGAEAESCLQFALDQMGGEIAGHPVEIIVADGASDSITAGEAVRKLVEEEGVVAVLGPTQIDQKLEVAARTTDTGVPVIYYNPTPISVLENYDYIFSSGGGTAQLPKSMADYLYNELNCRTINVIAQDSAGGHNYLTPLLDDFADCGGEIASEKYVSAGTANYTSYLADLPDADALIAWVSGDDAVALWSAWYDTGLCDRMPMYAATHGGFTDYFVCDELAESRPEVIDAMLDKGVYAPISYTYSLDSDENKAFVEAWQAEYGTVPVGSNLPGSTYAALKMLANAIESLDGDTAPDKLCAAIQAVNIVTPEGHLYFEEGSRLATKDIHIVKLVRLEDGTFNYEIQKTYSDVDTEE